MKTCAPMRTSTKRYRDLARLSAWLVSAALRWALVGERTACSTIVFAIPTHNHTPKQTLTRRRRVCCAPICDRRSACVHARAFQLRLSGCDGRAWNATHTQKTIETRVVRKQAYFIPVYVKYTQKCLVCVRARGCVFVYTCAVLCFVYLMFVCERIVSRSVCSVFVYTYIMLCVFVSFAAQSQRAKYITITNETNRRHPRIVCYYVNRLLMFFMPMLWTASKSHRVYIISNEPNVNVFNIWNTPNTRIYPSSSSYLRPRSQQ